MVSSTQSVSLPKRDGTYSFLRHLVPFGCIKTAIFSENAILSKTGLEEENSVTLPQPTRCKFLQFSKDKTRIAQFFQKNLILFFRNLQKLPPKKSRKNEKTTPWYLYFNICCGTTKLFNKLF